MKKILCIFLILIFGLSLKCIANENYDLRDYSTLEILPGTFIQVTNNREISTLDSDVGSKFSFTSTTDLYVRDTNVIPENSEFFGYIVKLNEPVRGTNASMTIKIVKVRLPDGFEMPMRGYIYTPNNNLIGGEMTAPETYDRKPSFRQGCALVTGYVPGPQRKIGVHKTISACSNLLIVLTKPLYITHTLVTN